MIGKLTGINKNTSFKGHSLVTNPNGKKEYQFYLPTSNKNVDIEVVLLDEKKNAEAVKPEKVQNNSTIPIWSLPVEKTQGKTVAYRFNETNIDQNGNKSTRYIYDKTVKIQDNNNCEYNEAIKSSRPALEMPKQMYHLMPDSFAANKGEILKDNTGNEIQRNQVNKFGGKISDIIENIPEIKASGARKVISTPIYGNDTYSNHGYWTKNPYQLTSTLGNINDFKKLQVELLKNGMGWVADGAFANEGLTGIHMQDLMRWGNDSPYSDWFDTKEFSSNGFEFGVLPPAGSEAEKYYDIKIINSPLIYAYDETGKPVENFGKKNPNYNPAKATYIQQFDTRLMDKNYINTDEALTDYTHKQTDNIYDVKNYKDSVQLFAYQVNPKLVSEKISQMSKIKVGNAPKTHSAYRDMLKKFDNFSLNSVDKDATIRNWTGKKDIVALNYKNPEVQKYIINTVKYWTNETDKILTTYIAKELANSADKAEVLAKIAESADKELSAEELNNILNGTYEVSLVPTKATVKEELKDFPLLAAELPVEIQSLLSDKNVIESKAFEKAYDEISNVVTEALKSSHPEAFEGENLTEEGRQLLRLASSDIMRYVSAYALSGETPDVKQSNGITNINLPEDFAEKVLDNVRYESATRTEAVEKLENAFRNGVKAFSKDEAAKAAISEIIKNSTENVDLAAIKMSKALITILELGLDHRIDASKDIMDLDLINQNKIEAKKVWNVVKSFWKEFVAVIREYNPKSYIIGEVTCLWDFFGNEADNVEKEFIKDTEFTTQTNYSYLFNIYSQLVHGAPEPNSEGHKNINNPEDGDNLNNKINKFLESGYADNIRYSHVGVDNHDKPRVAHGFAIDINKFFDVRNDDYKYYNNALKDSLNNEIKAMPEYKTFAELYKAKVNSSANDDSILDELRKSISQECSTNKSDDYSLFNNGVVDKFLNTDNGLEDYYKYAEALNTLSLKMKSQNTNVVRDALLDSVNKAQLQLNDSQIKSIKDSIIAYSQGIIDNTGNASENVVAEHFKTRPYNYVIEDAVKAANLGLDADTTEKICASIHNEMMKPAFEKYKAMLEIMVAAPGNPTIFAGDEYGETGFETPGNNVYQHNRNQIHRSWADDKNRPEFKEFHKKFVEIFNMRNKACFRPFVDGDVFTLDEINGNKNLGGIYRYDKNSDVITLINTNGLSNTRDAFKVEKMHVNNIPVNIDVAIDNAYGSNEFVHVDKNGNEINDGFYRMEANRLVKYEDAAFTKLAAAGIALTSAATYFVRKIKPNFANSCKQVLCSIK